MPERELYGGLIRLHILHHACEGPIFGVGIMRELERHGYHLGAGTLYPILHSLEEKGYLRSLPIAQDGRVRRFYRCTPHGRQAFKRAKRQVQELFGEIFRRS